MLFAWLSLGLVVALRADSRESPRTFCGRTLADARMLYCMGAEETSLHKRHMPDLLIENEMYQEKRGLFPFINDDAVWPWLPPRGWASQSLRARGKRVPGLVDECCLKPCYLSELLSYC
ncbi:hypothetical protein ABMA28_000256 [Loxostege sticticalis]|uniref:Insulin-like domain-containing protein n=1 Tax=Loxostege sticticalis TaxID=481309 RepID=A0ABD0TRJ9_LOXSC